MPDVNRLRVFDAGRAPWIGHRGGEGAALLPAVGHPPPGPAQVRDRGIDGVIATELPGCERHIYAATYGEPPDPPATAASSRPSPRPPRRRSPSQPEPAPDRRRPTRH